MAYRGRIIRYVLVVLLTIWGCSAMIRTWKKESVWIPRFSFYVPGFMFNADLGTSSTARPQQPALPLPEPNAEKTTVSAYVYSNTPLPVIQADKPLLQETNALQKYQKPAIVHADKKQIAVIISPIGLNDKTTADVLSSLPENVTVAMTTDAPGLKEQLETARYHGFETLLHIPMETAEFPAYDAGPNAVYSFQDTPTHQAIFDKILSTALPVTGVITQDTALMEKMPGFDTLIKQNVSDKGLIYLSTESVDVPLNRSTDFYFKDTFYPQALNTYFTRIEQKAESQGYAIAVFPPVPAVVQAVSERISNNPTPTVEFVPVSALFQEVYQ